MRQVSLNLLVICCCSSNDCVSHHNDRFILKYADHSVTISLVGERSWTWTGSWWFYVKINVVLLCFCFLTSKIYIVFHSPQCRVVHARQWNCSLTISVWVPSSKINSRVIFLFILKLWNMCKTNHDQLSWLRKFARFQIDKTLMTLLPLLYLVNNFVFINVGVWHQSQEHPQKDS